MSLFILLVDDIITLAIRGFGNSTPTWVALPLIRRPRIAPLYESGGLGVSMGMEPVLLGTERGRTPWVAPRGLHLIIYIEHKDNKKKLFLQIPGRKKRNVSNLRRTKGAILRTATTARWDLQSDCTEHQHLYCEKMIAAELIAVQMLIFTVSCSICCTTFEVTKRRGKNKERLLH